MGEVMGVVGIAVLVIWALMLFAFMGVVLWVVFGEVTGKPRIKRKLVRSMPAIEWVEMSDAEVRRLMPPARRPGMKRNLEDDGQQRHAQQQAGLANAQIDSMVLQEIVVDQMDRDSDFVSNFNAGSDSSSGSDW